ELGYLYPIPGHRQPAAHLDVLKVAHHGSKSSSTAEWLSYWQPQIAVISVGKANTYKHPAPDVIQRLEQAGAEIYRTDLHGEIQMWVDKSGITVKSKLK
ncbi:MAG: hypothetical protein K6T85_18935, partial [Gorillibacterium sp.]|nr:hypothetical protein [Gorillibacterium sp.]